MRIEEAKQGIDEGQTAVLGLDGIIVAIKRHSNGYQWERHHLTLDLAPREVPFPTWDALLLEIGGLHMDGVQVKADTWTVTNDFVAPVSTASVFEWHPALRRR